MPERTPADLVGDAERFVRYLHRRVIADARGDDIETMPTAPDGRFWLGRLAPENGVLSSSLGSRGQRLDPCATGVQFRPATADPWRIQVDVGMTAWSRRDGDGGKVWTKAPRVEVSDTIDVDERPGTTAHLEEQLADALARALPDERRAARIDVEVGGGGDGVPVLTVTVVNCTSAALDHADPNLYEVDLSVRGVEVQPFEVAQLPDSFRYDRSVPAYGINAGAEVDADGAIRVVDASVVETGRRAYWNVDEPAPDLRFSTLATDPLPHLEHLVDAYDRWGRRAWGDAIRRAQEEGWPAEVVDEVDQGQLDFEAELGRLRAGLERLHADTVVLRAFTLMNRAIGYSSRGRYEGWRPFQMGFVLASMAGLGSAVDDDVCDVIWFATGGGKTETYLGLLVTAALHDRLIGKSAGITAWSRFPLRMLSLQQTQRFADAMAGAERVRREEGIEGDPFSVGFFVGQAATPNRIDVDPKPDQPDPYDEKMPARYRVLMRCPFCASEELTMRFDDIAWRLDHVCKAADCPWPGDALPFHIVDDEIYRFLPTVVVGTLDKAASIASQVSMRGFVGPPMGRCPRPGHGYTYATRSKRPTGCLVPECTASPDAVDVPADRIAPSYRLQDELHLLRDTLGAVDAHYEGLLDHLQEELTGRGAKVIASSATLAGYERQSDVLYGRRGRVFPVQGPSATEQFWTAERSSLLRQFVAVAPRGVTLEYATDRLNTVLQTVVRELEGDASSVAAAAGIDVDSASQLVSLYGTDVVYGSTLRDLEAVDRSLATGQVRVDGELNTTSLTGRTPFDEVQRTLGRLDDPEPDFDDRIHIVTASSMMSHGVDVDRLNAMVMLGLPLTTAEFIQTTARIGRRWPGLVYVLSKIGRERDAGVYRSFAPYVRMRDRFVEPVPVTRRSLRVLEVTLAGLAFARLGMVHEPQVGSLTTTARLRGAVRNGDLDLASEPEAIVRALRATGDLDEPVREAVEGWYDRFSRQVDKSMERLPTDLSPTGAPMRSLRDVEDQAPIRD